MLANHAPAANDSPQGDSDQGHSDYDIILAALMDSARGRSFLQEYALRNRVADTATLLTAIGRIEGLLTSRGLEPAAPSLPEATPLPEAVAADAAPAESIEIEGSPSSADTETEVVAVEAFEVASGSVEVAAVHASAIEFLGPDLAGREPAKAAPAPPDLPARAERRDPFAEILALSDIEKIALFT
jgi:hypothetical protein